MKILNFASANIDYVYGVDHIVRPGETIPAGTMEIFPGGKGLNQSVAAAKAGGCVYHAGFIGSDGDFLMDILLTSGVRTDYVRRADGKNGHAIIQVNSAGENCIVIFQGTNGMFTREYIDLALEGFSQGDIVLLQNEINNIPYLIQRAWEKGLRIILNPSPFHESLKALELSRISYLILNETEARGFFGTENPDEIISSVRAQYPDLKLVLTLGKAGCIYADRLQILSCPAFMVETADTTAAGDCFTGYFAAQLTAGVSCEQAIRVASMASAITVSRKGAAPSIPYAHEVDAASHTLKPYPTADPGKKLSIQAQIDGYFHKNLTQASLEDLSVELGYCTAYTGVLIRKATGGSFCQLLQKYRCDAAAVLLRTTALPVSEIIHRVGYKNESFFRRCFRDIYHKSPLEYRKQWSEGR